MNVIRCPMCDEPMEVLMNGLAHCVNLVKDFKTFEEWRDRSCELAQHNISLPNLVWLRLRDKRDAALIAVRQEARAAAFRDAIKIANTPLWNSGNGMQGMKSREWIVKELEATANSVQKDEGVE